MNPGRIFRNYDHRRGADVARNICLRCFKFGHNRKNCRNNPIVACGKCYRTYMFTRDCTHSRLNAEPLTLRMVAGSSFPRPVIDVMIGNRSFEAYINMSSEETHINPEVLKHINDERAKRDLPICVFAAEVEYSITRRNREVSLTMKVTENQSESIILGMNFFMKMGFELKLDFVSINEESPVMKCPKTVDFLYNHPQGNELHAWSESNNYPLYSSYEKGEQPNLVEEPRVIIENDHIQPAHQPTENYEDVLQIHPNEDDLNID